MPSNIHLGAPSSVSCSHGSKTVLFKSNFNPISWPVLVWLRLILIYRLDVHRNRNLFDGIGVCVKAICRFLLQKSNNTCAIATSKLWRWDISKHWKEMYVQQTHLPRLSFFPAASCLSELFHNLEGHELQKKREKKPRELLLPDGKLKKTVANAWWLSR